MTGGIAAMRTNGYWLALRSLLDTFFKEQPLAA